MTGISTARAVAVSRLSARLPHEAMQPASSLTEVTAELRRCSASMVLQSSVCVWGAALASHGRRHIEPVTPTSRDVTPSLASGERQRLLGRHCCRRNGRFCNSGLADHGPLDLPRINAARYQRLLICGRCGKKFIARPRRGRPRWYMRVEPGLRRLWQDRARGRPDGTPSSGNGCGAVAELWLGAGHCRLRGRHHTPIGTAVARAIG